MINILCQILDQEPIVRGSIVSEYFKHFLPIICSQITNLLKLLINIYFILLKCIFNNKKNERLKIY